MPKNIERVGVAKMRRWWDYCYIHSLKCTDTKCNLYWSFVVFANKTDDLGLVPTDHPKEIDHA